MDTLKQKQNDIEFLMDFIFKAGADSSKAPIPESIEENIKWRLRAVLLELYDKHNGNVGISHVAARLAQDDDVMLKGFSERLAPYAEEGQFGRFFNKIGHEIHEFESEKMPDDVKKVIMADIFRHIAILIRQNNDLQVWDGRYTTGIHVMVGVSAHIDTFRDACYDDDLNALGAEEYFMGIDWLPVVAGCSNFAEALIELEDKLSKIPEVFLSGKNPVWQDAVHEACEHFMDVYHKKERYVLSAKESLGKLPKTLQEMLIRKAADPEGDIWKSSINPI